MINGLKKQKDNECAFYDWFHQSINPENEKNNTKGTWYITTCIKYNEWNYLRELMHDFFTALIFIGNISSISSSSFNCFHATEII